DPVPGQNHGLRKGGRVQVTTTTPGIRKTRPAAGKRRSGRGGGVMGNTGLYIAIGIVALLFLIPFYILIRNSLSTDAEITGEHWKFFPTHLQWGNISELFDDTSVDFARSLWNSLVVAVSMTVGILLVCSLAGYALARIPYKHANKVFYAVLGT